MRHEMQQYSYDLTQRLTFFVISIELIFCGYILLNPEKLGVIKFSSTLFFLSGAAAIFGLFWRFCYNQTFYENAQGKQSKFFKAYNGAQTITYWIYIVLTLVFFISAVATGHEYLRGIEKGKIKIEDKNMKYIEQVSQRIDHIQKGLDNIASSIGELSKIEPQVKVNIQAPSSESNPRGN